MNQQTNTTIRTALSLLFIAGAAAHLAWLTPANALAIGASVSGILGGFLALSNVFHVPAKVQGVMQKALAILSDVQADIPSETKAAMKKIAGVSVVLFALFGTGAVLNDTACAPAVNSQVVNTIPAVAACVIDVVEDVTVAINIPATAATCGATVQDIIAIVSALLDAQPDAAVVADAALSMSPERALHLKQWLAAAEAAKAAGAR